MVGFVVGNQFQIVQKLLQFLNRDPVADQFRMKSQSAVLGQLKTPRNHNFSISASRSLDDCPYKPISFRAEYFVPVHCYLKKKALLISKFYSRPFALTYFLFDTFKLNSSLVPSLSLDLFFCEAFNLATFSYLRVATLSCIHFCKRGCSMLTARFLSFRLALFFSLPGSSISTS